MTVGFGFGGTEPAEFERNKIIYKSLGPAEGISDNPNVTINGSRILISVAAKIFTPLQLPQDAEIISCVCYGVVTLGRKFDLRRYGIAAGGNSTVGDKVILSTPFNSVGLSTREANLKVIDNTQFKYWIQTDEMAVNEEYYGAVVTYTVPIDFKTSRLR